MTNPPENMEIKERKIKDLIPAEYNPRELTDEQFEQLKQSLTKFGMVDPIIINTHKSRKDIIVGGHQRCKVWESMGNDTVPTVAVNLTEEKEKELNIRLNKNSGQWDFKLLELNFDKEDLAEWGFEDADLTFFEPEKTVDPKDTYEAPKQIDTDIVLGDVVTIGEHRIMCGDCTDQEQMLKIMNGKSANMVFTDPPYNVDYGANPTHPTHKRRSIKNDKLSENEWNEFVDSYLKAIITHCEGSIYISMSDKELGHLQRKFIEHGGRWSSFIIWVKNTFVLSPKDYHSRHETILYGWKEGIKKRKKVEDRTQDDVWEIPRPTKSDDHPTMKPVELMERAINNSSNKGDIILDIFSGSGSTMVATELTGRKCYSVELEPKYVEISIRRMLTLNNSLKICVNGKDQTSKFLKKIEVNETAK